MAEGRQGGPAGIGGGFGGGMGGGPSGGLIGGSGYQQMDEGVEDSPTAADTTVAPNEPAPVVSVDTFEDIQQAARRTRAREEGYPGYSGYRQGNPGINEFLQWSGQHSSFGEEGIDAIQGGYTPSRSIPGSVNLAPMGINVGYRGKKSGAITSFDELDESTKAAVEGARIQSQSEDETENAIAQIFGAFQSIMGKAQKNTTNRVEGREGNAEQGDG